MLNRICFFAFAIPIASYAISDAEFFAIQRAQRQVDAHAVKANVAGFDEAKPIPQQGINGDEAKFEDKRGSFNKGLLHLPSGFPNADAFDSLVKALLNQDFSGFNAIQIGTGLMKLVNPQGSLAYSLSANDGWINAIPPAPTFESEEAAGEMVELYWTVLARDVPFNMFSTDATVAAAAAELTTIPSFKGPRDSAGDVTPETFLRGNTVGDLIGPYISQFLYQPIPFGNNLIDPTTLTTPSSGSGNDFNTTFSDWFTVISGGTTGNSIAFGADSFIRTPRDLAEYVHQDSPGQAAVGALYLLNSYGSDALDPSNPYLANPTQGGFVTFGIAQVTSLLGKAIEESLKAAWFQKWQVNRRLRPEEFGFYVQKQVGEGQSLGINSALVDSTVLPMIFSTYGSYFLPGAYPEGSPVHPSYPAGHATLMGAAVTILKAFYNEDFVIPSPLEPNPANTALIALAETLTVGGELNKLAANIALGRDHAGVHYRSDGAQGLALGEQVAIDILNNESFLFNEDFEGFTLTKFNGQKIRVGNKKTTVKN